MKLSKHILNISVLLLLLAALNSCSTTDKVPDGDQLYVGLNKIEYKNYEQNAHFVTTQEEIEAALATAPNGALLGSSYYRTPFPIRLWIWNAFSDSETTFGKWMTSSFGKAPILMSWVNPALRASVAKEVLRAHGYFRGTVGYDVVQQHNPKKAKIRYDVNMGPLFTIDSLQYLNFPPVADSLIHATQAQAIIHNGDPFDVSTLEAERTRISNLFRNNGYYYYQSAYASYLADTLSVPNKALLRFQMADGIPQKAQHKWYIGKIDLDLRRQFMETLNDSVVHRRFTAHFNGRKSSIRSGVILRNLKMRKGDPYSYEDHEESSNKISTLGLFSTTDFQFTPRDSSALCDTLDLRLNCVFDKPYDFYLETNVKGKTSGSLGPELILGFTKRNAFRGGEKLDINLNGSYEWQTANSANGNKSKIHSYEYGANASLEIPRLLLPFWRRHRFYNMPSTVLKVSTDVLNRSGYFKRHTVSGELTYRFQTSATSIHEFSPLILQYEYMNSRTVAFDSILATSPYLIMSMADQFIPKMRYSYTYTSQSTLRNPIYWQTVISEASNILSLGYAAAGKSWSEKSKKMFKNPYAQFFKIETDFRKTWQISDHDQFVAHAAAGIIWSYGNSESAPYSEQFYVGGANSIRAFNVRSIGPGAYYTDVARLSYMDQTGDIKLLANLEYRPRLFGNLYGAVFLDAGNVWALHDDGYRNNSQLKMKNLLKEMAVGTGIGLRYDLDFFVIRIDWGIGLHVPYKNGFYNIGNFKDGQCLHLAIGYPF
jgi:hypothetical protein